MSSFELHFTHIFTRHSNLEGLLYEITEHLVLLVTGPAEPNDFADLLRFLEKNDMGQNILRKDFPKNTRP